MLVASGFAARLLFAAVWIASTLAVDQAAAQGGTETYPNRAVRLVVPFPAGGPTDILSRVVAQRLSEVWGQPVVIENQPGANTAIAAARVAKMPADGYTLLAAMDVTMVLNPITTRNLSYDPLKDFVPITLGSKNTSLHERRPVEQVSPTETPGRHPVGRVVGGAAGRAARQRRERVAP